MFVEEISDFPIGDGQMPSEIESVNECCPEVVPQENYAQRELLEQYPEFEPFMGASSGYRFDLKTLTSEAELIRALHELRDDADDHFAMNGVLVEDFETTDELQGSANKCASLKSSPVKLSFKRRPNGTSSPEYCVFCFNNGTDKTVYLSHRCRDEKGAVTCPTLQSFVCSWCKATGPKAHTRKYCPMKPIVTLEDCERIEAMIRQRTSMKHAPNSGGKGHSNVKQRTPGMAEISVN